MKKILLASTMLVGTAGFAAADNANFTWSGKAYFGVGYSTGWNELAAMTDYDDDGTLLGAWAARFAPEVTASFTAGMMTTTDGGLEAGASITIDAAGTSFETDNTSRKFGLLSNDTGGSISDASAYIKGDFGKFTVAYDHDGYGGSAGADGVWAWEDKTTIYGLDDVPSDYDVTFTYTNTWGDFGVEAFYVMAPTAPTNGDMGAEVKYTMGDYMIYAALDYDASPAASVDRMKYKFGGSATMSGFTLAIDADYDMDGGGAGTPDFDWKASAKYVTGPYTVGAFVEDDGADDTFDYGANASYSLGGGVSLDAAYIYDNDQGESLTRVGVSMSF